MTYLEDGLAPLLGLPGDRSGHGLVTAKRWTRPKGIRAQLTPGRPRMLRVRYSRRPGQIKLGEVGSVEIGDQRWAAEMARVAGARLQGGTYRVASNNPIKGRLVLRMTDPGAAPEPDSPRVRRAKDIVNSLLGGTASVTVVSADEATGEPTRIEATHEVGPKLVASGYRRRVEASVSTLLPGRWRAKWDMEADAVLFEVRPSLPDSIWIPPMDPPDDDPLKNYRAVKIAYGVDEDGNEMSWRPAVSPMWLITGGTGSGKTSTIGGILGDVSKYAWPIWIADGKGTSFLGYRDWPNVQIVASRIEQQVAAIHRAHQLMEYRYNLVVDGRARSEDFEPLLVFVDEFTVLKGRLLTWYASVKQKGDPSKPPTLSQIGDIARMGREGRVHLVLAMQRPDADILTGEVRENFGQRTSLGPLSPQGAEMMWNNPVTGVAIPRGKTGRAMGLSDDGLPVEMQCYRVPDPKEAPAEGTQEYQLLERLRPKESRHDRLVIVPPEVDWDSDEPQMPGFFDYAEAEWVKAEDRPDLDPLAKIPAWQAAAGRDLASPMTLLGLTGASSAARQPGSAAENGTSPPSEPWNDYEALADEPEVDGYGSPSRVQAASLQPGDLICVDSEVEHWGVVEEEPGADFDDDECLVIAWRDAQDDSGQLIVPAEALIEARRPVELAVA